MLQNSWQWPLSKHLFCVNHSCRPSVYASGVVMGKHCAVENGLGQSALAIGPDNPNGPIRQDVHYSYPFIFLVILQPLALFSLLLVKTDLDQAIMKFISGSSESRMTKERRRNTYVQLSVNLLLSFFPHHGSVFLFIILGYQNPPH